MGKTLTAQNIALKLSDEKEYKIEPCIDVKDIKRRYKQNIRQVFFVDDICGKYAANINDIENWLKIVEFVECILEKGKTKIVATCRTEVFNEEAFQEAFKLLRKDVYKLTVKYSLKDKIKIASKYLKKDDKILLDILGNVDFSPIMCFLYSQHVKFEIKEFLNSPYETFLMEWNQLKYFDKEKFCVLLLCVIYNGRIDEAICDVFNKLHTDEKKKLKNIFECCKLGRDTSRSILKDKLYACVDTYFIKVDKAYKVIHDKMFDFLCCYFGKTFIAPILKFADDKLICERVQLESIQKPHGEFTIVIPSTEEHKYNERLRADLESGKIHCCLNNVQMRYKEYRYKFLDVVKDFNDDTKRRFIDLKDENGNTTFIILCLRGYEELVELFISFGADVEARNGWFAPLTAACRDGHLGTVEILLGKGSKVNQTNIDGETPLYTACICGHYGIVKRLLEVRADINKPNKYYRTPLYVSCLGGYENIVRLLIDEGATVCYCSDLLIGATYGGHDKIVEILINKKCDINCVDFRGRTALFIACEEGFAQIVKLLLDNNADTCKNDCEGKTPLHAARIAGNDNIVSMVTQHNSNVNILKTCQTPEITRHMLPFGWTPLLPFGWTPLYEACTRGDIKTIQSFIESDANVNMANTDGETPLVAACQQGNGQLIDMLLNEGAGIFQALIIAVQNNYHSVFKLLVCKEVARGYKKDNVLGWKSLMTLAGKRGSIFAVNYLIEKDVDVNQIDDNEHAPICIACNNGYDEIVELLLKNGTTSNYHCIKDGKTPLYFACKLGFDKIAETLLVNGANFKQKEEDGKTLLHIAKNSKVFKLLLDKGLDYCIPDKDGRYPLFESMNKGFDDISEFLVEMKSLIAISADDNKTALISVFDKGNTKLLTLLVSKGYTNALPNFNKTMLYYANRLGVFEKVKNLLQDNASYKNIYEYGYTPMIIADIAGDDNLSHFLQSKECKHFHRQNTSNFHLKGEVVYVANIGEDEKVFSITQEKYRYLFRACMTGKIEETMLNSINTIKFFKSKEPTGSIWFEQTPLCLASRRGHTEVVKLLLKYGAKVDLTFEDRKLENVDDSSRIIRYGYTPLFAALQRKYYKIVEMLLESGASLNKALYDACREGYFDTAKFLLDKGAGRNVNSICRFGQTALDAACIGGSYTLIELLIAQGAILDTKSITGTSNFDFYHEIFKLWEERNETTGNIAQALLH
ncbi:ankyrin-2-like [Mytilus trossulus]|uniref:ankyrin-2-like n=1 Tax=Mytilus trossulus TaxID=6551 RepID=UPI003004787A